MKTIFNPKKKKVLTYGEALDPAMKITNQEDADQYKEAYINWQMEQMKITYEEALNIVNSNLGYYAGYYSTETRLQVEKLFNTQHPFLGKAEDGTPTPEEIFKIGQKIGESFRNETE